MHRLSQNIWVFAIHFSLFFTCSSLIMSWQSDYANEIKVGILSLSPYPLNNILSFEKSPQSISFHAWFSIWEFWFSFIFVMWSQDILFYLLGNYIITWHVTMLSASRMFDDTLTHTHKKETSARKQKKNQNTQFPIAIIQNRLAQFIEVICTAIHWAARYSKLTPSHSRRAVRMLRSQITHEQNEKQQLQRRWRRRRCGFLCHCNKSLMQLFYSLPKN